MSSSFCRPRPAALPLALSTLLAAAGAQAASSDKLLAPPAAPAVSTQRLIVRFHEGAPAVRQQGGVERTVEGAMSRAGVSKAGSSRAGAAVTQMRRLGNGAELLHLAEPLDSPRMQRLVQEIAADPAVRYVEPDTLQTIAATPAPTFQPDDPKYASHQWHLHDPVGGVGAPAAWTMSRGSGVVVAVIDTGILPEHPDFDQARLLPGYDFITDTFISRRAEATRVAGALDRGDWNPVAGECRAGSKVQSSSWHGTHVAGTIAQATNNGVGAAGLAPEATLLPVRALGRCGGWSSDIVDAITWAAGGRVEGVPDNADPADVINLSLGGGGRCSRAYQEAIDGAVARGAVVVVAAGNASVDVSTTEPASCKNIVNVASTGATGRMAGYSNYGDGVDLSAPGGDYQGGTRGVVWQAGYTGTTTPTSGEYTYVGMAGTSMAAPHVAAVAALVQSARVAAGRSPLSPARMEALLVDTARGFPIAPQAAKPIGRGIVDAPTALRGALDESCDVAREACKVTAGLRLQAPLSGQSGDAAGQRYQIEVEAGRPLRVFTYGGRGDAVLYVRQGTPPQPDQYDARSARAGSHQSVLLGKPVAGTYHVLLAGASSYEGVTIVARQ